MLLLPCSPHPFLLNYDPISFFSIPFNVLGILNQILLGKHLQMQKAQYPGILKLKTDCAYPLFPVFEMIFSESLLVVSDALRSHGLYSPWNSPGQNTGVGSLSLLQGIFPTQVSHIAGRFFTSWATREDLERILAISICGIIPDLQEDEILSGLWLK